MTHILKQLFFADFRHLDAPAARVGELREAFRAVLPISAIFAAGYLAFYGLLMLCLALNISTWWAGAVFAAVYLGWLWKLWKERSV
jgi:hypothetical protein